jgi:hypothetical protein
VSETTHPAPLPNAGAGVYELCDITILAINLPLC